MYCISQCSILFSRHELDFFIQKLFSCSWLHYETSLLIKSSTVWKLVLLHTYCNGKCNRFFFIFLFFSPGIVFSLMTTLNHLDLMNAHSNLTITSFAVSVTSLETDPLVVDAAWVALWLEVDMGVAFVRDA